jgi:DNA-binding Lrp family transcriptional regulator
VKNIRREIIDLLKTGYCTPRIAGLATRLREPATTIHYNVKQLEKERIIRAYKAVFDYKKIDEGFCSFVLISLTADEYGNPERIANEISRSPNVESVDIVTGDWEIIAKVRVKDIEGYFQFVKDVLSKKGIAKAKSLNSMKQIKSEFVEG